MVQNSKEKANEVITEMNPDLALRISSHTYEGDCLYQTAGSTFRSRAVAGKFWINGCPVEKDYMGK